MKHSKINNATETVPSLGPVQRWIARGVSGAVVTVTLLMGVVAEASAKPEPLPGKVTDAMDTVKFWIQTIAGALGIITLMLLGIGLWWARHHDVGAEFKGKAAAWVAGALIISTAGVIAPVFVPA